MGRDDDLRRLLRRDVARPLSRALDELGRRRRAALEEAHAVQREVEELLSEALEAGLTLTEVARLSSVSRPTLYEMQRRASGA